MKKELLSEINRFREIVGLSLIKESIIPSSLLSNLETMLSPGGRNIEDFFRTGSGKVIDDVYEFVKKSAYGPGTTRDELATLVRQFLDGKLTESESDVLLAAFLRSGDENITNLLYKGILNSDATIGNFMKKFEPGAKVRTSDGGVVSFEDVILSKNEAEIQEYLDKSKLIIDRSGVGDETKKYFKEKITTNIENIRGRGTETMGSKKPLTMDDIKGYYDDAVLRLKKDGKTLLPFDNIEKISETLLKQFEGKNSEEIVDFLKREYGQTEKQISEKLAEGGSFFGRFFSSTSDTAANAVSKWKAALGLGGVAFGVALYMAYDYLNTTAKGIKTNYEVWASILGDEVIKNLPDELKSALYAEVSMVDDRLSHVKSFKSTGIDEYTLFFSPSTDGKEIPSVKFVKNPGTGKWISSGGNQITTKIYTQSEEGFKEYLNDNKIEIKDIVNDTAGSGYWINNNKNYQFTASDPETGKGTWNPN